MAYIRAHNNRSDVTYKLAMNQFGDKFVRPPLRNVPKAKVPVRSSWPLLFQQPPPDSWDWRTKGVIPPVENQGSMGSSGAVAVTEVLESVHAIRTGQLLRLSVKEVVDCCTLGSGRMMLDDPYECIAKLGGLCSESSYPPAPSTKRTCRSKQCTAIVNDVNTTVHIKKGDEVAMMLAVLQVPLVVSVDASSPSFMFYKSGVYTSPDPSCGASLDHVMQVVGYGKDGEYWILKNSWVNYYYYYYYHHHYSYYHYSYYYYSYYHYSYYHYSYYHYNYYHYSYYHYNYYYYSYYHYSYYHYSYYHYSYYHYSYYYYYYYYYCVFFYTSDSKDIDR
nr:hypothetical protein BaRGS_002653 [Batillaria attramentaria]